MTKKHKEISWKDRNKPGYNAPKEKERTAKQYPHLQVFFKDKIKDDRR